MNPLLQGVRVLDLSRLLPGPFCSLYLAQMGATVIKIEEPNGGDYGRSLMPELHELINAGKHSVTLDLRRAEDGAAFRRLAREADVVLESFRPGVMERLGCGYQTLRAENPRLVYAALTGYGQSGPYRDWAGHDMNYNAFAGVLDQTGPAGGAPVLSNFQIADLAGGALTCAVALLGALYGARASGQGCFVDSAMLDGTAALQVLSVAGLRATGRSGRRGEDVLTGALPNYSLYECADGGWIALGALEPKFFQKFCTAVGRPELLRLPMAPGPAGAGLREALTTLFKTRTRDDWAQAFAGADCCLAPVLSPAEMLEDPQLRARGMIGERHGKPALRSPLRFGPDPLPDLAPAPALGQHNEQWLGR